MRRALFFLVAPVAIHCGGLELEVPSSDAGTDAPLDAKRSRSRDAQTDEDAPSSEASRPAPNPFRPGDHWIGTYTCPQGLTNLDLAVVSTNGNDIDAVFDFDWDHVTGSFHVSGAFEPFAHMATFQAGSWISRPSSSWYVVGMTGTVELTTMTYSGDIVANMCGSFSVVRTP